MKHISKGGKKKHYKEPKVTKTFTGNLALKVYSIIFHYYVPFWGKHLLKKPAICTRIKVRDIASQWQWAVSPIGAWTGSPEPKCCGTTSSAALGTCCSNPEDENTYIGASQELLALVHNSVAQKNSEDMKFLTQDRNDPKARILTFPGPQRNEEEIWLNVIHFYFSEGRARQIFIVDWRYQLWPWWDYVVCNAFSDMF